MNTKQLYLIVALSMGVCAVVHPASVTLQEEKKLGTTPVLQRANEFIDVINSHDSKKAESYIKENYDPKFLKVPMDAHVGFIEDAYNQTCGIQLQSIKSTPTQGELLVRGNLTDENYILSIKIDSAEPFFIKDLNFKTYTDEKCVKKSKRAVIAELNAYMKKLVAADVFSGDILIAHHGKPFYMKAFGQANKDFNVRNTIDTKFNLGSMNKMFTAVAIAQLVEQGKLSFEDPLSKFLPNFPNPEDAKKIKIKHLLTHTAGLGNYFNKKFYESSRTLFRTVDDMLKLVDDTAVAFEPGSKERYSNTGFLILGVIIEKVSGQSYFDYVRENIYKPAGMVNTDSYELDKVNHNLAVGYIKTFTDNAVSFNNNIFHHVLRGGPAGGGYSTVKDLLKFDQALRENKLIGAQIKEQLFSARPELNSPGYGYGFVVNTKHNFVGHNGKDSGISSLLVMGQKSGYTVVILSNYSNGSVMVGNKVKHLIRCMSHED